MKHSILFKTLIDLLFILHVFGLFAVAIISPFGLLGSDIDLNTSEGNQFYFWITVLLTGLSYIIFLRGLYFLRKLARYFLSDKIFTNIIIDLLKKIGQHFVVSGLIYTCIGIILFIGSLMNGKLNFSLNISSMVPLFLITAGLFSIMQSHALKYAKHVKEEHELTI